MKTKTIKNKCGGKSSGCCADITLPYGITPERVADNTAAQVQSSK
jgi:hypothetical protein